MVAAQPDVAEIAAALRVSVSMVLRALRQAPVADDLSLPEASVLARLDRGGPMTAAALARLERISPQSIGATVAALEARALVRARPTPATAAACSSRSRGTASRCCGTAGPGAPSCWPRALAGAFTAPELEALRTAAPLLERLAQRI